MRPPFAISPDGVWLGFTDSDYRPGVRHLTAGAVRTFPVGAVSGLRWSPDSTRLAVVTGGGREVWEVRPGAGTAEARLRLPAGGIRWVGFPDYFPNGDLVLVARDEAGTFSLIRVGPEGGPITLLTRPDRLTGPRVSPDGKRVAFLAGEPGETGLWVLDLGTGGSRPVAGGPAENPVWSPDSGTLAFERPEPGGSGRRVMTVEVETGRLRTLGPGSFPHWVGGRPVWVSPDGEVGGRPEILPEVPRVRTGGAEVRFAAWSEAGRVVLDHGAGLILVDLKAGWVRPLERFGPAEPAALAPGVGALGTGFGIPSTGYVSDTFRPGHPGLDIAKPFGLPEAQAPIVAAYPGRVVWAGDAWSGPYGGYGNLIILDHGYMGSIHVATYYAHWRTKYVNVGDFVWTGQRLADQSDYGWTTGVHLHFEVREGGTPGAWRPYFDGTPVDPTGSPYLNRPLKVGDYVVAAGPAAPFRSLLPLVRR